MNDKIRAGSIILSFQPILSLLNYAVVDDTCTGEERGAFDFINGLFV